MIIIITTNGLENKKTNDHAQGLYPRDDVH